MIKFQQNWWQQEVGQFSSEIQNLINSIRNKENLPQQWKCWIILPVYEKGEKTDYSNRRGLSLLSSSYKTLSNILLSRLYPYAEKLLGASVWISTQQVNYRSCILYSSNTWEKLGIRGGSMSAIYMDLKKKPKNQLGRLSCIIFSLTLVSPWKNKGY